MDAGKVTIHLQNLTRRTSFLKTLSMAEPDTTSADWIAEAPSVCGDTGYHCDQQTLTNFGSVKFTGASAVSGGTSGSISDPAWQESPVVLQAGVGHGFGFGFGGFGRFAPEQGVSEAQPSTLVSDGSAFSITWHQLSGAQPSGGYGGGYGGGSAGVETPVAATGAAATAVVATGAAATAVASASDRRGRSAASRRRKTRRERHFPPCVPLAAPGPVSSLPDAPSTERE